MGLSVTARIREITQPLRGYVSTKWFREYYYNDGKQITSLETGLESIQGLAVDYLLRFMTGSSKEDSFNIPILGAREIDKVMGNNNEFLRLTSYLERIIGLDDKSIIAACKLTGYDSACRRGVKTFVDIDTIKPTKRVINNVRLMVQRGISFFEKNGPIVLSGFDFEGAYTKIISSGDGDYLTTDTLWDLKCTNKSINKDYSLQLLIYYLMGYHSVHPEFKNIKKLGIFNPLQNSSYVVSIADIPSDVLYRVSNEVIGYKMVKANSSEDDAWKEIDGIDIQVTTNVILNKFVDTGFNYKSFDDGIHEITFDDYWTFVRKIITGLKTEKYLLKPHFKNLERIYYIRKNSYIMFAAISDKGKISILHKGERRNLSHNLEYYYEHLDRYGEKVKGIFSHYWDSLYAVSSSLREIQPDLNCLRKNHYSKYIKDHESKCKLLKKSLMSFEEWYEKEGKYIKLDGKVHGCIVDLDYLNHVYINPYDGNVTVYNATSKYDKNVFKNLQSLLSANRPEMLSGYIERIKADKSLQLIDRQECLDLIIQNMDLAINEQSEKEYSTEMYSVSGKMVRYQLLYDFNLVTIWNEEMINLDLNQGLYRYIK